MGDFILLPPPPRHHRQTHALPILSYLHKGAYTNYVDKIMAFFDHLPPSVDIFYGINVDKKSIFSTTYPLPLVNVVCECPLSPSQGLHKFPSQQSSNGDEVDIEMAQLISWSVNTQIVATI